jgi:hypothetical protein
MRVIHADVPLIFSILKMVNIQRSLTTVSDSVNCEMAVIYASSTKDQLIDRLDSVLVPKTRCFPDQSTITSCFC